MPPIFDFECPVCKAVEERLVRSSDAPPVCPVCNKEMHKLISGNVSFRLYGEGFHNRTHRDSGEFS